MNAVYLLGDAELLEGAEVDDELVCALPIRVVGVVGFGRFMWMDEPPKERKKATTNDG